MTLRVRVCGAIEPLEADIARWPGSTAVWSVVRRS